jgi:hypothetical protein
MVQAPTRTLGGKDARLRLGELLVRGRVITEAQLREALREQSSWGGRLGQNLVDAGAIDEGALAHAVASQLGLHVVDLDRTPPIAEAVRLVPVQLAERHGLLAIALDRAERRILVACADPANNEAMDAVRRATGFFPQPCVATASQIDRAVRRFYYGEEEPLPTPDPRLDVSRRAIAPPERTDPLEGLSRNVEQLVSLLRRDPGARD